MKRGVAVIRSYGIYKVKKIYQPFIIGREKLLFDLLKEDHEQHKDMREVDYLCDRLEEHQINEVIVDSLAKQFTTVEVGSGEYKLTHPVKGSILITLSAHALTVTCDGSRMLDLDLFVALSGSDDRFFAVMGEIGEWGWLKPVKYTDFSMKRESVFL